MTSSLPDFSTQDYQAVEELGRNREGGRISYLAKKLNTEELVAIKQFRFAQDSASWQGFKAYEREIQILREINHPRIPRYIDAFETSDGFCMVQQYFDAPSLASKKTWQPEEIKEIAISILDILVDLQDRTPPVIHRDIKPENILIDKENNAYLIDFGLARIRSELVAISSVAAGTPGFMPPEELFNRPVTEASDLYSLGATIICLLTNTPSGEISRLIAENYRFNFKHLVTGINPRFLDWLTKMIEPNVKERYPKAAVALAVLQPIQIKSSSAQNSLQISSSRTNKLGIVILTIGLLVGARVIVDRAINTFLINSANSNNPKIKKPLTKQPNNTIINSTTGQQWFNKIKPHCNAVEVNTYITRNPYPNNSEGIGYAAGCYALAGKIKKADSLIQMLPEPDRAYAARIVFHIGHPVADAGDDESAGPIMELVLKYLPENWSEYYMALYHAGMSAYVLGEYELAKNNLTEFLRIYQRNDGWRRNSITVLQQIEQQLKKN